jgi:hypothetical protein
VPPVERDSWHHPREAAIGFFLEHTQPEMLLAAIPQDVNELGLISSPFQFPCLVQVLKGKRWDLTAGRNLRRQAGHPDQGTQNSSQS